MSKEEFIEHMSAFLYRVYDPKTREMLEMALTRYEEDRPSLDDEVKMAEAETLRSRASMIEGSVEWRPEKKILPKSVDETIREIAENNNGQVRRTDGMDRGYRSLRGTGLYRPEERAGRRRPEGDLRSHDRLLHRPRLGR